VERWNGKRWSIQPVPSPASTTLEGVSCPSPTVCTAVGTYNGGAPLAERWNGNRWRIQRSPNVGVGDLHAVSCATTTACTAVGETDNNTAQLLLERWNGTRWLLERDPPGYVLDASLVGVSCPLPSACTAVGVRSIFAMVARWNGTRWSVAHTPATDLGIASGVSCASADTCTVVGFRPGGDEAPTVPFAERWDGTRWWLQKTASPGVLRGVTCPSLTLCIGVGAVIQRWQGRS
jgi:hypothetical protein